MTTDEFLSIRTASYTTYQSYNTHKCAPIFALIKCQYNTYPYHYTQHKSKTIHTNTYQSGAAGAPAPLQVATLHLEAQLQGVTLHGIIVFRQ